MENNFNKGINLINSDLNIQDINLKERLNKRKSIIKSKFIKQSRLSLDKLNKTNIIKSSIKNKRNSLINIRNKTNLNSEEKNKHKEFTKDKKFSNKSLTRLSTKINNNTKLIDNLFIESPITKTQKKSVDETMLLENYLKNIEINSSKFNINKIKENKTYSTKSLNKNFLDNEIASIIDIIKTKLKDNLIKNFINIKNIVLENNNEKINKFKESQETQIEFEILLSESNGNNFK